jgi:hypothetical protein
LRQQTQPDNIQHFCQNNGIIEKRCFGGWYQQEQTKYKQPCGGFEITNFKAAAFFEKIGNGGRVKAAHF